MGFKTVVTCAWPRKGALVDEKRAHVRALGRNDYTCVQHPEAVRAAVETHRAVSGRAAPRTSACAAGGRAAPVMIKRVKGTAGAGPPRSRSQRARPERYLSLAMTT